MLKTLALSHTLFAIVLAANDWNTPCTSGKCSFESGDGVNSAWAAIDVDASSSTLSDITPAAGWTITGCNPDWADGVANVTLTCEGTDQQVASCSHLFEGGGAINKFVRLPQSCGVGPFARVASVEEADDLGNQFLVSLDYEFSQIPANDLQSLSFTVSASNVKSTTEALRARRHLTERSYPIAFAPRFDLNKTVSTPITFSKSFTLINQTFDCPAADGGVGVGANLEVDADVSVDAQLSFGLSLTGSILPFPKVQSLQLSGTFTGNAAGTFDVSADVKGSFDTGSIQLFSAGLPGLDIPGILSVGPQFLISTEVVAALELQANAKAGVTFDFPSLNFVFPASAGKSAVSAMPTSNALGLSLEPQVTADGSVTAHLIPRLEFGVEVLDGLAEATIFVQADGSATLGINATASADIGLGDGMSTDVNACIGLDAGVDVTVGAVGSIKPIFTKDVSFDIFKKDFDLFDKCFGPSKRDLSRTSRRAIIPRVARSKRVLTCPSPGEGGILTSVLDL